MPAKLKVKTSGTPDDPGASPGNSADKPLRLLVKIFCSQQNEMGPIPIGAAYKNVCRRKLIVDNLNKQVFQKLLENFKAAELSEDLLPEYLAKKQLEIDSVRTNRTNLLKAIDDQHRAHIQKVIAFKKELQTLQDKCEHFSIKQYNDAYDHLIECEDCGKEL